MTDEGKKIEQRREALKKLATLSAFTAPTVLSLLASSSSYAQGSGTPVEECAGRSNRNPNNPRFPSAVDEGGNGTSGIGLPNRLADCGVAGANSDA